MRDKNFQRKITKGTKSFLISSLCCLCFLLLSAFSAQAQLTGGSAITGSSATKPKPKPTPTPSPTPKPSNLDPDWIGTSGSSWNVSTNWSPSGVPNGATVVADFKPSATNATAMVTAQDTPGGITLGTLSLLGTGAQGWTINLTSLLTMNNSGAGAKISNEDTAVGAGSTYRLTITGSSANNITLADNLTISNTSGSTNSNGSISIQAPIKGTGTVTISNVSNDPTHGQIALAPSANSTYVGNTTIQSGAVTFNNASLAFGAAANQINLGSSGFGAATLVSTGSTTLANNIVVASGTTGTLTLGGLATLTFSGTITLNGNVSLESSSGNTVTFSNTISGVGGITKADTGTVTLSATANSYQGDTTISAGTLRLGAANVIPDGTGKGNVSVTGTLDLNTFSETINGLSGTGTVDTVAGGTPTLTVGNNDQTSTFSGVIKNTTGTLALTKIGTGTLTLSGSSANTYSGTTTINAGELDLNKSVGVNAIAGNITIGDGSGTDILGVNQSDQIADSSDVTINSSGQLNLAVNKTETIDALNGSSGATVIVNSGATLTVGANNEVAANYHGGFQSSGTIAKTGTGSQTFSDTSSIFSGFVNVLNGDLRFDGGADMPNATIQLGDTSGSNVAVLSLGFSTNNVSSALTVRSGSSGTKLLRSLATSGTNTYSGAITLNDNLTVESSSNGSMSSGTFLFQDGSINLTNKALTVDTQIYNSGTNLNGANGANGQGTVTINEVISGSGGSIVKDGSNTLNLQGTSNTYSGGTTIKDGTVAIYGDGSLGAVPGSATNNIFFAASALTAATNTPTLQDASGDIALNAKRNINVAIGVTGRFDSNGNTFTVNGVINGSGNIAKIGVGTLVLNGDNTYTGTTAVNVGTLLVNGNQSTATGAVTVNSGATLGGNGTLGGAVDVKSGGTLSPGASVGTLHTGALTLEAGSTFAVDLTSTPTSDLVVAPSVTLGALVTGPSLSLNISGSLSVGQQFFIVDNTGLAPVTGVFSQGATMTSGNYVFAIDYLANYDTLSATGGNDILLQVTAIPEPSTYAAAALAFAVVCYSQRRRFKRAFARA